MSATKPTLVASRRLSKPARRAAATCGVLLAAVGVGASSAGASGSSSVFSMSASTSGVSLTVFNEGFPLVTGYEANAPSTKATLNSRGQSTAYAATPDPGQDVSELPSVLGTAICGGAPIPSCSSLGGQIPAYPTAYAQAGDQPKDLSLPSVHLHAEATGRSANGQATVGASGATNATSTVRLQANDDGSQDATADTDVDGLTLATYLKLTGIHSHATLHRGADGAITTSSTFEVGSFAVNGQRFGFKDGSFTVLGQLVPLPVPVQTVLDALKAVGVTATFLPADKTATGVTSGGLQLTYVAPAPPAGLVPPLPGLPLPIGVGLPATPTNVTYTLGRVAVKGTYKAIPAVGDGVIGGGLTGGSPPPSPSNAPSASTAVPPIDDGSSSGGSLGTTDIPAGTTSGDLTGSTVAPVVAPAQPAPNGGVVTTAAGKPLTTDSIDIYLALVVAAFAAFGGATAIRFLGVRRTWTS